MNKNGAKPKYTPEFCRSVRAYQKKNGPEETAKHFGLKNHQVSYVVSKLGKKTVRAYKKARKVKTMEIIPAEPVANDKVLVFVTTSGNIRQVLEQLL